MNQRKYILDLLKETRKIGIRPIFIPMELNHKLSIKDESILDEKKKSVYQLLVGKLIYLILIRLDITYAVNIISQFIHALTDIHMQTIEHILCYLKKNPGKSLLFIKWKDLNI